ncbi:MAG: hypothetical protein H6733_09060 [Alphaproteobacteria bacterium]|nr:hypothetical protein [Alphaproteobacteria bacterium]
MTDRVPDSAVLPASAVLLATSAALALPLVQGGGLAPLCIAAAVGAAVGVPVARVEATAAPVLRGSAAVTARTVGQAALAAAAVATIGRVLPDFSGAAIGVAGLGWVLSGRAVVAHRLAVAAVVVAMLVSWLLPLSGGLVQPWPLLEPVWSTWAGWTPDAATLGLLLPLAGTGVWAHDVRRLAPRAEAPIRAAGIALALALATALGAGLAYTHAVLATPDAPALGAVGLGLGAAGAGVGALLVASTRPATGAPTTPVAASPWHGVGVIAWTAWFTVAGPVAAAWIWQAVVPVALAGRFTDLAVRTQGSARLAAVVAALVALVAAVAGAPSIPDDATAAGLAAVTLVALLWTQGIGQLRREVTG